MTTRVPGWIPDRFTVALVATVAVATLLPARGEGARVFAAATAIAIALLFFLHGAKLSRAALVAGVTHWRLHLLILGSTFVVFPLIGLAARPLLVRAIGPELTTGVLFLCVLPSTVQSAIAFTALARGNVAAAICSASASTLLGVVVTPLLAGLVVAPHAGAPVSLEQLGRIALQLFVPFFAGHLLRPWIAGVVERNGRRLALVDRGSILLVVYTAFSASVIEHLWSRIPVAAIAALCVTCGALLAVVLVVTTWLARRLGFSTEDEIAIVFCGSKKSLASGAPMANVLFPAPAVGAIVLPAMLFHQLQLMVCAAIAQRYARRVDAVDGARLATHS